MTLITNQASPQAHDRIRWGQLVGVVFVGLVIAAAGVITNVALAWTDIGPRCS